MMTNRLPDMEADDSREDSVVATPSATVAGNESEDRGLGVTTMLDNQQDNVVMLEESHPTPLDDSGPTMATISTSSFPLTRQEQDQVEAAAQKLQSRRSSDRTSCKPWHNVEDHEQHRAEMVEKVSLLLRQRKKSPSDQWLKELPIKAKKLEHKLYHAAKSFDEYHDPRTLKYRLVAVVQHFVQDYKSSSVSSSLSQRRKSTRSTTRSSHASFDAPSSSPGDGPDGDTDLESALPRSTKMRRQLSSAIENDKEVNARLQEQLIKAIQRNAATLELMQANNEQQSLESATSAPKVQPQQPPRLSEVELTERLLLQQQKDQQALILQQNWLSSHSGPTAPSLLNAADLSQPQGLQGANSNALANLIRQQHALQGNTNSASTKSSNLSSQLALGQQQQHQQQMSDTVRLQAALLSNTNLLERQRLLQNDALLERQRQIQLLLLEANNHSNNTAAAPLTTTEQLTLRLNQLQQQQQQRNTSVMSTSSNLTEVATTGDLGDAAQLSHSPFDW